MHICSRALPLLSVWLPLWWDHWLRNQLRVGLNWSLPCGPIETNVVCLERVNESMELCSENIQCTLMLKWWVFRTINAPKLSILAPGWILVLMLHFMHASAALQLFSSHLLWISQHVAPLEIQTELHYQTHPSAQTSSVSKTRLVWHYISVAANVLLVSRIYVIGSSKWAWQNPEIALVVSTPSILVIYFLRMINVILSQYQNEEVLLYYMI